MAHIRYNQTRKGARLVARTKRTWTDWLGAALVGVITFAVSYVFSLRGVDPQHQGFLLKTAVDVARGLTLYRDTFTQYGSIPIYAFAAGVRLFGETIVAINGVTCFVYALCGVTLYAIVRRYTNALVAAFAPLLAIGMAAFYFWNFHPWPSVFALLFSLTGTLSMIRYIDTRKLIHLLLCGASTAAMFWSRQPQGLTALAGAGVLLGLWAVGYLSRRETGKAMLAFLAGNAIVHIALLMVVLLQGAFADWWTQMIVNAFAFAFTPASESATADIGLWEKILIGVNLNPQIDFVWRVLVYGTLACFLVWVFLAFRQKRKSASRRASDPTLLGLVAFSTFALFNWPHYYPTLCYRHVLWSDYPMFGVLCVALYRLAGRCLKKPARERVRRALCTLVVLVLMTALCASNLVLRARIGKSRLLGGGYGADFHAPEYAEEDTTIRYGNADYGYLDGLYLSAREARFYDALFSALAALQAQYPEKNIVNLTDNALYSVFSSDNAHKRAFDNDPREFHYPEQMDATMAYIAAHKPIVISNEPLAGFEVVAYIDEYNGDVWRYKPFYVLLSLS